LWTTANPPKSPDGVAYWGSTQTIIWKEQSEYVPPAETDQDEADFGSFAEKDIVDATEYAFLNATTFEPLWDIFDPPKRVIKSTDEIINPETRQPYWQNASEVFLVPISTAVQYLPLPYNVETSTFYWGPGEYPQNYDGSY
jgi:hypothetical protein